MRRILSTVLALTLVAALVGCGGSTPANSPESSKQAQNNAPSSGPEKQMMTVKVGSTEKAALKNLPIFLAGFAEQESVKIEYMEYKGGSEVAKALLNGEIDMALVAVDQVLKDKSGEFRLLAMVTNGPGQAVIVDAQHKDTIKSVKNLAGQKVGVSSLGSGPHKTLNELLAANGMDPKSVQVLPVGLNATEVLGTGKVVAMVTIEPYITLAEETGKGVILVDARKPEGIQAIYKAPEVPWIGLVTRSSFMQEQPEATQRMVSVVSASLKFIAGSSPAEISQKVPGFFKTEVKDDEALFTKMLLGNKGTFSKDGRVNPGALEKMWKDLQASGAAPKDKDFPFEQMVETKFLDKVH